MKMHPIHPAIVHFPVACWSLAVLADAAHWFWGLGAAVQWAGGLLTIGCAMALLAAAVGLFELTRVPEGAAMKDAYWHMGLMLSAWSIFTLRLWLRYQDKSFLPPDAWALTLDALGFLCLTVGGWMGGRLVYTHGVGQSKSAPLTEQNAG